MTIEQTNQQIFERVREARRILLLTDERIDGDTTGSTLSMFHYLKGLSKDVRVFSPSPWSEPYRTLPGSEAVMFDPAIFHETFDLVMIFDCSDGKYLRAYLPQPHLIVFDHHATNPRYGFINHVVVEASSTGEIVWQFFKQHHVRITKEMATCLLTAICTDTTLFSNAATNHLCMEAASELGLAGAKLQDVVRTFYMNKSVNTLRLWGVALERLQELPGGIIYTCLRQKDLDEMHVGEDQIEGISNFLIGMVMGAKIVCFLRETGGNSVKGSLRTLQGNVAQIAERLGGGGHIKAAGFTLTDARLLEDQGVWSVQSGAGKKQTVEELLG